MRNYSVEAGFVGGYVNSNPFTAVATVAVEEVKVGSFVELTATGVKPLTGAGKVAGLVAKSDALAGDTIPAGENVTLITKGSMYAKAEVAVTAGAKVFVVNTGATVGSVVADATDAEEISAKFSETRTTAGVVAVDINL